MSEHADLEALSAFVDGEAPEWAGHVAGCDECRAAAEGLRTVAAAVGAPIEPAAEADRERAVAAALGRLDRPATGAEDPRLARRRQRRTWNPAAVASVAALLLVGILGLSALVTMNSGPSSDESTAAGTAPESAARDLAGGSADSAAPTVPPTDLGDVPDAATLQARARATAVSSAGSTVSGGAGGAATSTGNSGASSATSAGSAGNSGAAGPPQPEVTANVTGGANLRAAAPSVVGPRPCEEQARGREPVLGEVVYYATARQGPRQAVVLGFSTGPSPSPVTLLMLAQEGCAELLRAAAP